MTNCNQNNVNFLFSTNILSPETICIFMYFNINPLLFSNIKPNTYLHSNMYFFQVQNNILL